MSNTILVIEDDHDIRAAFRQSLENMGHRVFSATNGSEGLLLLKKLVRPDLIILDMFMPVMNGEEFLKEKNSDEQFRSIPLLALTTYDEKILLIGNSPFFVRPNNSTMILKEA
jgi:CheY-like chemotaxis protein